MVISLVAWVLLGDIPPASRPAKVPEDAQILAINDFARIYHWRRPDPGRDRDDIWIYPDFDQWPSKTWGAKATLTPVPLCCGAKRTYIVWRQVQPAKNMIVGWVSSQSNYHLDIAFQSTSGCNCNGKESD